MMEPYPPVPRPRVALWICLAGLTFVVLTAPLYFRNLFRVLPLAWWMAESVVTIVATALALQADRQRATALRERAVSLVTLTRAQEAVRDISQRYQELGARFETRQAALNFLVDEQLPAVAEGRPAPPIPSRIPLDDEAAELLDRMRVLTERLRDYHKDRHEAIETALVALGRDVQASAHRLQEEATRMVQRHPSDPDILQTSMRVDHAAAQQARRAQSLAVLCGEWPGQQWQQPLALVDVVRAAAGRIIAYQRVEVSGDSESAVAAKVAEPLIHLIAELLANATQSSPPTTQVLVAVRPVQRGAVIEIDDGGVGMDQHRLEMAREIASGEQPIGLADLGETPQTGLGVVGAYARRHGFRVDLRESVYGGLQAIVLIPADLIDIVEPARPAASQRATGAKTVRVRAVSADDSGGGVRTDAAGPAPTGLPRRRSLRGMDTAVPTVDSPARSHYVQTPEEAGQWMNAFLSRSANQGSPENNGTRIIRDVSADDEVETP